MREYRSALGLAGIALIAAALAVRVDRDGADLRAALDAERDARRAVAGRLSELERTRSERDAARARVEADLRDDSRRRLEEVEARAEVLGAALERTRARLETEVRVRRAAEVSLAETRARLDAVAPRDFRPLLAATARIESQTDVGSGTVIWRGRDGDDHVAYILTAWHIVQHNAGPDGPIPLGITIYAAGHPIFEATGTVVARAPSLDVALVESRTADPFPAAARLLPRERVQGVPLFAPVHAVGCPLGYPPIPTSGMLTSKSKALGERVFWMVTAPTIFGNSGGGIYLGESGELIGVLSRISAYKSLIDVAVPHMGIVTDLGGVYDWLAAEGYGFIFDPAATPRFRRAPIADPPPPAAAEATAPEADEPPPAPDAGVPGALPR